MEIIFQTIPWRHAFLLRRAAAALALVTSLLPAFVGPAFAQSTAPVITEFMADNGGSLSLNAGTTPDWIDIYNPGSTSSFLS